MISIYNRFERAHELGFYNEIQWVLLNYRWKEKKKLTRNRNQA